jgi:uncharacterized protein (TIGR03435 family)
MSCQITRCLTLSTVAGALWAPVLFAQARTSAPLVPLTEFEVASVRPNTLDDRIVAIDVGPGRKFTARGYTLKLLIQRAWGMKGFQISGGPDWLDVDRYDVSAIAPATPGLTKGSVMGDLTEEQLKPMLRALLADRFHLKAHQTTKMMSGFVLSQLGGPSKLTVSSATEEHFESRRRNDAFIADGITMKTFAMMMGAYLSRPVVDETGLTGLYDVTVAWNERADQIAGGPPAVGQNGEPPAQPVGMSLMTALREQLGLKLTSRRVAADTLVIDSAERASSN